MSRSESKRPAESTWSIVVTSLSGVMSSAFAHLNEVREVIFVDDAYSNGPVLDIVNKFQDRHYPVAVHSVLGVTDI